MPYEPLTVQQIKENLELLKEDADAGRIYDTATRKKLQQAYDGGENLTDHKNEWIKRYSGESDETWDGRKERLRAGVNPCRLIPDKIVANMTNGTITITCEDAKLQEAVEDCRKKNKWNEKLRRDVERQCSVFGTCAVTPFFNEAGGYVDYWWSDVDQIYPVLSGQNARGLDALFISRPATAFTGHYIRYNEAIDVWTPIERDRLVKGIQGSIQDRIRTLLSQLRGHDYMSTMDDTANPYGCIPFAIFHARPSAKVTTWFALSDINEAYKTLEFILEQINNLSEVMRHQAFATLVMIGDIDEDVIKLGPDKPIAIDSTTGAGDAKYIYPDVPFDKFVEVIDTFYRWAFEVEGIPMVAIRTQEQPESGVAVKIKLRPLQELTEERRKRHAEAEKQLWILTAMAHQIYMEGKSWGWEESRDYIQDLEEKIHVEHADDYNPTDEQEDLETVDLAQQLGVVTEYEKWKRFHPNGSEDDYKEWLDVKAMWDEEVQSRTTKPGIQLPQPDQEFGEGLMDTEELDQELSERRER